MEERKPWATLHTESRPSQLERTSFQSHGHGLKSRLHLPAEQIIWPHCTRAGKIHLAGSTVVKVRIRYYLGSVDSGWPIARDK